MQISHLNPLAILLAVALAGAGAAAPAAAANMAAVPLFDAHLHYSSGSWVGYPVEYVRRVLRVNGVRWALLSSSPDEGTVMLHEADRDFFIPLLSPYRDKVTEANWLGDAGLMDYLTGRLDEREYAGIGELHIDDVSEAGEVVLRKLAKLAAERNIILQVHAGAGPLRTLFGLAPEVTILWAHAGLTEPPEVVGALMEEHERLYADTSLRVEEIAPGGELDPAWRDVVLRFPDRFLIGTNTVTNARWHNYSDLITAHRAWLSLLPEDAALNIAYRNGLALFGREE